MSTGVPGGMGAEQFDRRIMVGVCVVRSKINTNIFVYFFVNFVYMLFKGQSTVYMNT